MISEFNTRITVKKYSFSQSSTGANTSNLIDTYPLWAKLENLTGSNYMNNLGIVYSKAFRITTRYEASRPLSTNDIIEYAGNDYTINSHIVQEEGKKKLNVIVAYTSNVNAVAFGS